MNYWLQFIIVIDISCFGCVFSRDRIYYFLQNRCIIIVQIQDGWSVSGIQTNLSDSLIALNFENGAHHSDLNGVGPSSRDTDDIREGHQAISNLLGAWLGEISSSIPINAL